MIGDDLSVCMNQYRHSGSWMSLWDDRILEILSIEGPETPSTISDRDFIHVGNSNISRRLSKLNDNGLVSPLGNGVYQITDEGRNYLLGEYDAETGEYLERPDLRDNTQIGSVPIQTTVERFSEKPADKYGYNQIKKIFSNIDNPEDYSIVVKKDDVSETKDSNATST